MQTAAKFLVGTHDYRNFCKMDVANGVVEFVRKINNIEILPLSPSGVEKGFVYRFVNNCLFHFFW